MLFSSYFCVQKTTNKLNRCRWRLYSTEHIAVSFSESSVRLSLRVRFVGGVGGGLTPHWLKTTPTLVTENYCLGGSASTPPVPTPPVPIQHHTLLITCAALAFSISLWQRFVSRVMSFLPRDAMLSTVYAVDVHVFVPRVCVCVCYTRVLYQNG